MLPKMLILRFCYAVKVFIVKTGRLKGGPFTNPPTVTLKKTSNCAISNRSIPLLTLVNLC